MGNISEAKTDLLDSKRIAKKNGLNEILAKVYANFGYVEERSENYNSAIKYYEKANEHSANVETRSVVINNIGHCFEMLDRLLDALTQYKSAISIGEKGRLFGLLIEYYCNAAWVSKDLGQQEQALKYAYKAYESVLQTELPNKEEWKLRIAELIKEIEVINKV